MKPSHPLLLVVSALLIPAMSFAAKGGKTRNKSSHRHGGAERSLQTYDRNANQTIDADELPRLQSTFSALRGLDKNSDGQIDMVEAEGLKLTGSGSHGHDHSVIRKADTNGNHKIDPNEIEALQKSLAGSRAMKRVDKNGDGKLGEDELQSVNSRLGHGGRRHGSSSKTAPSKEPTSAASTQPQPAATPTGGDPFLPGSKTP